MGVVRVDVEVSASPDGKGRKWELLRGVLVDTGATLTVLPGSILRRLRVAPLEVVKLKIGDGRLITRQVGGAWLKVQGHLAPARVIFGRPRDPVVLGLTVLEQVGLTVNPTTRKLVSEELLLLSFRKTKPPV